MAEEEKKPSASKKLYGKTPKIEPEGKGDTVKSEGGAPKEAATEAKDTAGDPPSHTETKSEGESGTEAKGDVMAGTDGIPTYHTQSGERAAQHHRHMMEHVDGYHARERDHLMAATGNHAEAADAMMARHHAEMKSRHSGHEKDMRDMGSRHMSLDMPEKDEGKSGTNKD